ncbi:MAG: tetratricopeptide repeat protein [Hyphomicrobiaceae bacterium]|nr:tetratricopeptide repeat protein [Hyphomicrobiaceae bacterium]
MAEARTKLLKELRLTPASDAALQLLGAVASEMGRHDEAVGYLRQASHLAPSSPGPRLNLGAALLAARRFAEAADALKHAVTRWPDIAEGRLSYGNALLALGNREQAAQEYRAALALNPAQVRTCANLALALYAVKDDAATSQICERLLRLDPNSVVGQFLRTMSRQSLCHWEAYEPRLAKLAELIERGETMLGFAFTSLQLWDDARLHRRCAALEIGLHGSRAKAPAPARLRARHNDRIRVAYVSADFRKHPVTLLMTGLIEHHDRDQFDIVGISLGEDDTSAERQRVMTAFDKFLDVREQPIDAIIAAMRDMEVDIAVDLMGLTERCRPAIFLQRAAPVQVSYIGFPGTSGIDAFDYLIADAFVADGDLRRTATEKLVIMPDCYQCNYGTRALPADRPTRASCGLPEDAFVFCSFNNIQKLTPHVFDLWMRILREAEGSVLWLFTSGGAAERNLLCEAERRGVDPKRLIFADHVDHSLYMARNGLADLHLDTFPYGGHTTASDALWAGRPVLTRAGRSFASRVCGSLLTTIGVPELITTTAEDYEALAIRLARDRPLITGLKRRIEEGRSHSPLFDTRRFCRNLERAYARMVERSRAGQPPEEIDVGSLLAGAAPVNSA